MDYSYRNSRYRRRKRRQYRRMIAIIVVFLTAGVCVAGYGLVNLLNADKSGKEGERPKTSFVMNGEEEEREENSSAVVELREEPKASLPSAEEGEEASSGVESKTAHPKKEEKNEKKKSIEDLTTIKHKDAEKYFKDTAFIGDSRTQGLQLNAGIRSPKFFAGRGLNVKNALTDKVVQGKKKERLTVVEALKGSKYKKIYICFGINELGWSYPDIFIERYKELIEEIRKEQEEAEIVVYGILPVTKKKSDKDKIFNMKNVKKFNKLIKKMAKDIEITYADLSPAIRDKKGFLPAESTIDGIHMNREYCKKIIAYIANKKI